MKPDTHAALNVECHVLSSAGLVLPDRKDISFNTDWKRQPHLVYRLDTIREIVDRSLPPDDTELLIEATHDFPERAKAVLHRFGRKWHPSWNHLDIVVARGRKGHREFPPCSGCWGQYTHGVDADENGEWAFSPLVLLVVESGKEERLWPTLVHELAHVAWAANRGGMSDHWYEWVLEEGAGDLLVEELCGKEKRLSRGDRWTGTAWREGLERMLESVETTAETSHEAYEKLAGHYRLGEQVVTVLLQREAWTLKDLLCATSRDRQDAIRRLVADELR